MADQADETLTRGLTLSRRIALAVLGGLYIYGLAVMEVWEFGIFFAFTLVCVLNAIVVFEFGLTFHRFTHPLQLAAPILMIEFVFAPIGVFGFSQFSPDWLARVADPMTLYRDGTLLAGLGLGAMLAGHWLAKRLSVPRSVAPSASSRDDVRDLPPIIALFAAASALSSILVLASFSSLAESGEADIFTDRRVLTAGAGYREVLAVCGYFATILQAYRAFATRSIRDYTVLAGLCVLSAIPYLVLGHRGGVVYPLFMVGLVRLALGVRSWWIGLVWSLGGVLLLSADFATHVVRDRYALTETANVDFEKDFRLVRSTFSHIELLAMVVDSESSSNIFPSTILAGLFNWVPRLVFPDKPLTTGPVLAMHFSPSWVDVDGLHRSSYTTGPFIELYFNGGVPLLLLGSLAFGIFVERISLWYLRRPPSVDTTLFFVLESFLWGWNVWIDDIGGMVNKQIVFLAIFAVYLVLRRVVTPRIAVRAYGVAPEVGAAGTAMGTAAGTMGGTR